MKSSNHQHGSFVITIWEMKNKTKFAGLWTLDRDDISGSMMLDDASLSHKANK